MIIIAGYSHAKDIEERDAAVAAFAPMVGRARKHDGCIQMAITADSLDPTRSNIIEIWRDEQTWKGWRKVAKGPRFRAQESHVSLYRSDTAEKLS
jgi:quinol monooxygenase YgiN